MEAYKAVFIKEGAMEAFEKAITLGALVLGFAVLDLLDL
jgi:hypothetical protein